MARRDCPSMRTPKLNDPGSPHCPLNRVRVPRTTPLPPPNPPEHYTATTPGVAKCAEAAAHPARQRARHATPPHVWVEPAAVAPLAGQSCPPRGIAWYSVRG